MNNNSQGGSSMANLPMNAQTELQRRTEILKMIPVLQSLGEIYKHLANFLVIDRLAQIPGLDLSKIDISRITHIGNTVVKDYQFLKQTQTQLLKSIEQYCQFLEPIIDKPQFSPNEADQLIYLGGNIYADFQIWGEQVNTLLIDNANDLLNHIRQACVDPNVVKTMPPLILA